MSKHLLFHVKPKPYFEAKRWQQREGHQHSLDALEHITRSDSLPQKGADSPMQLEWSSG